MAANTNTGYGARVGGLGIEVLLEISLPYRFLWWVYRVVLGPEAVPET